VSRPFLRLSVAAVALTIFVFCVATIAARPWAGSQQGTRRDPRVTALAAREKRLKHEAQIVRRTLQLRWDRYRHRLRERKREIRLARQAYRRELREARSAARLAAAQSVTASGPPAVSVVTLAPVAQTKTS
jgi:hypothetical protein